MEVSGSRGTSTEAIRRGETEVKNKEPDNLIEDADIDGGHESDSLLPSPTTAGVADTKSSAETLAEEGDEYTLVGRKRKLQIFSGISRRLEFNGIGKKFPKFHIPKPEEAFVLWDVDSTRPRADCDFRLLLKNIEKSLRQLDKPLKVSGGLAFGDLSFSRKLKQLSARSLSEDFEFYLYDVAKRIITCPCCGQNFLYRSEPQTPELTFQQKKDQPKEDMPHILLKTIMLLHAIDAKIAGKGPIKLLIITSDPGFATTIVSLNKRKHEVYVAFKEGADQILRVSGKRAWLWDTLCQGGDPLPSLPLL